MKRIVGLLLALALAAVLAACGGAAPSSVSTAPGEPSSQLSAPPQAAVSDTSLTGGDSEPAAPRFANPSPELVAEAAAKYAQFESITPGMSLEGLTEILGEYDYTLQYSVLDTENIEYYYENTAGRPACRVTIKEGTGVVDARLNLPDNLDWLPVVKEAIPNEELADVEGIITQPERGLVFDWTDFGYGSGEQYHYIFFNDDGDFVQHRLSNAVVAWEDWKENGKTIKEEYEELRDA